MEATLAFPNSIIAKIKSDLAIPSTLIPAMPEIKVLVTCERGSIELYNYIMPTIYHRIKVTTDAEEGGKPTVKSFTVYKFEDGEGKGEDWWTTYRYQLEAFVDKLKGRTPQTWVSAEDSIANLHWIEQVYAKVCILTNVLEPSTHENAVWAG
jgi:predicted dehydrogenase